MKIPVSKYIVFIVVVFVIAACRKNMTDLNTNLKAPTNVPGETLFSNAEIVLADALTTPNININIFELIEQYWAQTIIPRESLYDLGGRDIPLHWWNIIYRDVIEDFNQSIVLMRQQQQDPALLSKEQAAYVNKIAIAKLMRAYSFSILVNTFGDIPYTEALQGRINTTPKYDKQQDVYYALLDTINQSIQEMKMDPDAGSFGTADIIYKGDVNAWHKFANAIKLKLGINIADVDRQRSKTEVEDAAGNVFTSNDDNALLRYTTTPPNVNPIWISLVQSNNQAFVAADTIVDIMNARNDPRRPFYFTTVNGEYVGYRIGNSFSDYSYPSAKVEAQDFPATLMDYAEVEFFLAEAAARDFNVGRAESHYNAGVMASIEFWSGTADSAQQYLSQPVNQFDSLNWKKSIGVQAWINYYIRGFDAWIEQRRLDYPQLKAPPSAVSKFPVRYTYPSTEINLNKANYEAASAAIGGDSVTTRLFWDVQ